MLQVGVHFLPLLVYVETEALAKQWLEAFSDSAECDPEDVGVGGCVENDSECCVIKDYLAELSPKPSSFADYVKAREKLARAASIEEEKEDQYRVVLSFGGD